MCTAWKGPSVIPQTWKDEDMTNPESLYELSFTTNTGQPVDLSDFQGKPVLVVNTASKCGFTPQYDDLQKLHEELGPKGLVVLGFPCDQFAHQEPGDDAQIQEFCKVNYGVTFPLSTKVDVNGKNTHPVFAFLKEQAKGALGSSVKWNFTKFLIAPDGKTVKRYAPKTKPTDLIPDITELLDETAATE
jgi:glutathione peroxidase